MTTIDGGSWKKIVQAHFDLCWPVSLMLVVVESVTITPDHQHYDAKISCGVIL